MVTMVFGWRASEALARATSTACPGKSKDITVKVRAEELKVPDVGVSRWKRTLEHEAIVRAKAKRATEAVGRIGKA